MLPGSDDTAHIYAREIDPGERSSLTLIAGHIRPGTRVLDIGTGDGALGRFLQRTKQCRVDGITINPAEAERVGSSYRSVKVADVESCDLPALLEGSVYDHVVCADVLEHLRHPQSVLQSCRQLVAPGGTLILSVPHVGYSGLVAELFNGDFVYRKEGLLDATHLRFYTRRSLLQLLAETQWHVDDIESVNLDLYASEFKRPFDLLPPVIARYLLARPDALTYQFVVVAHAADPLDSTASEASRGQAAPARTSHAVFCAQLFGGQGGEFSHSRQVSVLGAIGQEQQKLIFPIPETWAPLSGLRLDPADRPGFMRLRSIRLVAGQGLQLWSWEASAVTATEFGHCRRHELDVLAPRPDNDQVTLLLLGADPSVELPIPQSALDLCGGQDCTLELVCDWPMSADYLAAVQRFEVLGRHIRHLETRIQEMSDTHSTSLAAFELATGKLETQGRQLKQELADTQHDLALLEGKPLIKLHRMVLDFWRKSRQSWPFTPKAAVDDQLVDIVVPIYRDIELTRRCVESVLAAQCKTPYRLTLINDASPEPGMRPWLEEIAANHKAVTVLENETNLGFVATVNRGMHMAGRRDVILLNSDAEVANDWLDRLHLAATKTARVGTVTPFSNNATICSYPAFCENNPLVPGHTVGTLDHVFARTNAGQSVDIPTAVGFCMYIRRACLDDVGEFDLANFGHGYGEENDFCCRATARQWRHLHALDVFVHHAGGVSFGDSRHERQKAALAAMRRLHPDYEEVIRRFVALDPAKPFREAVQRTQREGG